MKDKHLYERDGESEFRPKGPQLSIKFKY